MTVRGAGSGGVSQEPAGAPVGDAVDGADHTTSLGIDHLADVHAIGHSDHGVLYSATDPRLERRVAVRVLNPLLADEDRVRFGRESKLLGLLSAHPNVVTVYDAGLTADDRPYVVMELIEGGDLAGLLARHDQLQWTAAADIAVQVCAGLEAAHRSGTLHRDLRPDNILMAGVTPKLTDFGVGTRAVDSEAGAGAGADDGPSAAKRLLHRAPETFDGIWDERTDLYSVASILYELIDGHPPFWRPGQDSPQALRLRMAHETAAGLDPDLVPPALNAFIAAALSKDPFDRPQSADEFAHELRLIQEGRTTGSVPSVLHGSTATMALAGLIDQAAPAGLAPAPPQMPPAPAPAENGAGQTTVYQDVQAPAEPGHDGWFGGFGDDQPIELIPSEPVGMGFSEAGPAHPESTEPELIEPDPGFVERPQLRVGAGRGASSSTGFVIAMAMIAFGVIGLAAVVAYSALSSDGGDQSAPVLPDPDQPGTVEAVQADSTNSSAAAAEPEVMEEDAEPESTTTTADPVSTSETTIPRLPVPNMIGVQVQEATRRLADAGFEVLIVGRIDNNATPGTVTLQKPDAGSLVALPLTVTLYIPRVDRLPPMVGRQADAVCLELRALALTCNQILRNDDQVPAGSVISSDPAEGTVFGEGTRVDVVVSRGPVITVAVPDVRGQTRAEAEATLTAAGFTVIAAAAQPSENVEKDLAVGTDPVAATSLATDQPVTILISSGPPTKVTMPDLVGVTRSDAETALSALGLSVTVLEQDRPAGDPGIGVVVSQEPSAGGQVAIGSTVVLTVGRGQAANPGSTSSSTTTTAPQP